MWALTSVPCVLIILFCLIVSMFTLLYCVIVSFNLCSPKFAFLAVLLITLFYSKIKCLVLEILILFCSCLKVIASMLCSVMSDCSPPGSFVYGIFRQDTGKILEQVAIFYSRGSSWPRDQTRVSCISCMGRWILYHNKPDSLPEKPE